VCLEESERSYDPRFGSRSCSCSCSSIRRHLDFLSGKETQHQLLNFWPLFDTEDKFWELSTWHEIPSSSRGMSTVKISSRSDKLLSRFVLRYRLVGDHLHFVRYYGQRPSLRRRFSQRYNCHSRGSVRWTFNILAKQWTLESWCLSLYRTHFLRSPALTAIFSTYLIVDKSFRRIPSCALQIWLEKMRKYSGNLFCTLRYMLFKIKCHIQWLILIQQYDLNVHQHFTASH
jgi:hypothetical protein